MSTEVAIDLNCDLGEGAGNDAELMTWVTSANIACGAHAGDETEMRAAVMLARHHGVAIGAHPGFADREHFGRRELTLTTTEIIVLVRTQIEALCRIALEAGSVVTHVKPHGALYTLSALEARVADAVAEAVAAVDDRLWLYGLSGGELLNAGQARGLRVAAEVFADRTYQPDGSLTPRGRSDALIKTEADSIAQALQMIRTGRVTTTAGTSVTIRADTLCLHGDGAHAVAFARGVRKALLTECISVRALVSGLA